MNILKNLTDLIVGPPHTKWRLMRRSSSHEAGGRERATRNFCCALGVDPRADARRRLQGCGDVIFSFLFGAAGYYWRGWRPGLRLSVRVSASFATQRGGFLAHTIGPSVSAAVRIHVSCDSREPHWQPGVSFLCSNAVTTAKDYGSLPI